jgi:hypothetical protein
VKHDIKSEHRDEQEHDIRGSPDELTHTVTHTRNPPLSFWT